MSKRPRLVQKASQSNNPSPSYDQFQRSPATEDRLNMQAAAVFSGPAGEAFLDYLESITLRAVGGPDIPDAALRHQEGTRWLVQVIRARIHAGHQAKIKAGKDSKNG